MNISNCFASSVPCLYEEGPIIALDQHCVEPRLRIGTAERRAVLEMLQKIPGIASVTVGGDKGFDTAGFVRECRNPA